MYGAEDDEEESGDSEEDDKMAKVKTPIENKKQD